MTARVPDWPERLDAVVAAARERPFAWGVLDCALFAADGIAAVTGVDPAAEWRGTYADQAGARRLLHERGGLSALAGRIARRHGWPRVPATRLGRGDVALVRLEDGSAALAVCLGTGFALPGPCGLASVARDRARLGWRIG